MRKKSVKWLLSAVCAVALLVSVVGALWVQGGDTTPDAATPTATAAAASDHPTALVPAFTAELWAVLKRKLRRILT